MPLAPLDKAGAIGTNRRSVVLFFFRAETVIVEMVTMGAGRRRTFRCGTRRGVLPVLWLGFVA